MRLALFDFDGTISKRDSFLLFLWFVSRTKMLATIATSAPGIVRYLLKQCPGKALKETFLTRMFAGYSLSDLENYAAEFCAQVLPGEIRPGFWECLQEHCEAGDLVYVVTASPRFMLEPWCRRHGVYLLGTEIETDSQNKVTGRLLGENCKGEEKVKRIGSSLNLSDFHTIYAYGDTPADLPMLDLADGDKRYYKPFR